MAEGSADCPKTTAAERHSALHLLDVLDAQSEQCYQFQCHEHGDEAGLYGDDMELLAVMSATDVDATRNVLRVLRRLLSRRSEPGEAAAAERCLFGWARQWLRMSQDLRLELTRALANGFVELPHRVQARHVALLLEYRSASWQNFDATVPQRDRDRFSRGIRAARASLFTLSALEAAHLDEIGKAATRAALAKMTPIGMARVAVHLAPHRWKQLQDLLVWEGIMEAEACDRLFVAFRSIHGAIGTRQFDAILAGLDAIASVGADAVGAGAGVVHLLKNVGMETMVTVGQAASSSCDMVGQLTVKGICDVLGKCAACLPRSAVVCGDPEQQEEHEQEQQKQQQQRQQSGEGPRQPFKRQNLKTEFQKRASANRARDTVRVGPATGPGRPELDRRSTQVRSFFPTAGACVQLYSPADAAPRDKSATRKNAPMEMSFF